MGKNLVERQLFIPTVDPQVVLADLDGVHNPIEPVACLQVRRECLTNTLIFSSKLITYI